MVFGELCIDCVQRTNRPAGRAQNFCAALILGRDYVAPDCPTQGPFVSETTYKNNTNGPVSTILTEAFGCSKVSDPSKPVVIRYDGDDMVSMKLGDEVIYEAPTAPRAQE
jgi:hypothetical protein